MPAIDILDGRVVRLRQGRFDQVTVYAEDPAAEARGLSGRARSLHVVDLEGSRSGRPSAGVRETVRAIAEAFGEGVQIGGGVRSIEAVEAYLAMGATRVVLGTAAIRDPALVRAAATRFPGQIIVALDAKDGAVAVAGWEETSDARAVDVARELARGAREDGVQIASILYTDVARDGTGVGPNLEQTRGVAEAASPIEVLASGGVGSLDDLRRLAALPGVRGAIVGRAFYEKIFTLEEAQEAARVQ